MSMLSEYIHRSDLAYQGVERLPEAGLPLGNGRTGSLVWCTPNAVHLQINRVDVFGFSGESRSVGITDSDFSGGCAFVDIEFGNPFEPVFGTETLQELDVYDGEIRIHDREIDIRIRLDMDEDAFLFSVGDRRPKFSPLSIHLRTLRYESQYVVGRRNYTHPSLIKEGTVSYRRQIHQLSTSMLSNTENTICLKQEFTEDSFYCSSLVEVGTVQQCVTEIRNPTEAVLTYAPGCNSYQFVICSSATFEKQERPSGLLNALLNVDYSSLWNCSLQWWHDFWARAPIIDLSSADGLGQKLSAEIVYFLYLMASTSRGKFMPRYGGLLFNTDGDFKMWGSQYWWHNQSCYFNALFSVGLFELTDSMISHLLYQKESCERAAWQQWRSKGIWIPETTWFDGPGNIPEDLTEEFQKLYSEEASWETRSKAFMDFSEGRNTFDTRFGWIAHRGEYRTERGFGPYGYVNHIFSATAKISYCLWTRYTYTMDLDYLKDKAYPIISGTADFYTYLPLIRPGEDGKLHFYHCNNHESIWGGTDTISELAAVHGILPIAIRAAEILDVDEERRNKWQKLLSDMTPMMTTIDKDALSMGNEQGVCWVNGCKPYHFGHIDPTHLAEPMIYYDLWTPETRDPEIRDIGRNTLNAIEDAFGYPNGHVNVGTLDLAPDAVARSCDPKAFEVFIKALYLNENYREEFCDLTGIAYTHILDNRMSLREGPQSISAQRQGHILSSVASAVCHAFAAGPGEEPVLYVFSSLPKEWNAKVHMATVKNYMVDIEHNNGEITCFTLTSNGNESLLVHNPWDGSALVQYSDGFEIFDSKTFRVKGTCKIKRGKG